MAKQEAFQHRIHPDRRTKDKVAIVGFTDHRAKAFELPRDEWEVWGINELHRAEDVGKFDRWFEVHPRKDIDTDAPHIEAMSKMDIPVYMQEQHRDIPPSVAFPRAQLEELSRKHFGRSYYTSSIAWEVGLAIHMGFKAIHIYGVDMAQDCLAPDTKVLGADLRWIRAGDVQAGDELLAFDEEPGEGTHRVAEEIRALAEGGGTAVATERKLRAGRCWRVSKVLSRSVAMRPSYRILFGDGTSVVASAGHMWLTRAENENRWKRTDELLTPAHRPDRPTRVIRALDVWDEDHSWEAGYLAAAFDGEGTVGQYAHRKGGTHTFGIGFAQRENAMADRVRVALGLKGFSWGEHVKAGTDVNGFALQGGRSELLRFLGQIRPERLLAKFRPADLGLMQRKDAVAVTGLEFLGEVETVGFTTSTRTLIAEGFASHNSEYARERPCCEAWLGVAAGLGIEVHVPPTSDLLKSVGVYGFGDMGTEFSLKIIERKAWLHRQDNDYLTQIRRMQAEFPQFRTKIMEEFEGKIQALVQERDGRVGALEADYKQKMDYLLSIRNQTVGAIADCEFWERSWAIPAAADRTFSPDRSKDPRTGIKPASDGASPPDADALGVSAAARVAEPVAA